jgi:hypothetical protein
VRKSYWRGMGRTGPPTGTKIHSIHPAISRTMTISSAMGTEYESYVPSKDHISVARSYIDQLPRKGVPVRKVETPHDRDRLYGGSPPKVTLTVLPRGISICYDSVSSGQGSLTTCLIAMLALPDNCRFAPSSRDMVSRRFVSL